METVDQRIVVMGISGSGKTTYAASIAEAANLTHIELDLLNWRANWYDRYVNEFEAFEADLIAQISKSSWVLSGGYTKVRPMILARAQAVVWLDLPKSVVLRQVVTRSLKRAIGKEPILNGNYETFERWLLPGHPIQIVLRNYQRKRQQFQNLLGAPEYAHLKFYRCQSWVEAEDVKQCLLTSSLRRCSPGFVETAG